MQASDQRLDNLGAELARWDGKAREPIAELYEKYRSRAGFAAALVSHAAGVGTSDGATWLLKTWLEAGGALEPDLVPPLLAATADSDSWTTRLHVLQLLPRLPLDASHRGLLEPWVRDCLVADHAFVRAWAMNAFWELARLCPELRDEAQRCIDSAAMTEPASVQARIRAIRKRPF